jgi:hypothetical protein
MDGRVEMSFLRVPSFIVPLVVVCGLACGGCRPESDPRPDAEPAPESAQPVTRIVFIGQEKACKCARTRIDVTWAALQSALEAHSQITVESLTMDQDEDEFDPYDEMQSLVVAPGIYFFDAEGRLISLLQGEQTKQQILQVLEPKEPRVET